MGRRRMEAGTMSREMECTRSERRDMMRMDWEEEEMRRTTCRTRRVQLLLEMLRMERKEARAVHGDERGGRSQER